jgi:hypothetical protein
VTSEISKYEPIQKKLTSLEDSTGKLEVLSRVQILLCTVGWALRFTSTGVFGLIICSMDVEMAGTSILFGLGNVACVTVELPVKF